MEKRDKSFILSEPRKSWKRSEWDEMMRSQLKRSVRTLKNTCFQNASHTRAAGGLSHQQLFTLNNYARQFKRFFTVLVLMQMRVDAHEVVLD